jgi:hypothetical protein
LKKGNYKPCLIDTALSEAIFANFFTLKNQMQFQKTKKKDIDEVRFYVQNSVKARTKKYVFNQN